MPFTRPGHLGAAVAALRNALACHGVTALPTETFYGLAVTPGDGAAIARLAEIKGRPSEKAFPVVGASLAQLETLVEIADEWRARLLASWPAPLTVVLPCVRRGRRSATLAVRVPNHGLLRDLLAEVGPLTATSANRSGAPALDDPSAVARELGRELALLLDGGRAPGGLPTTLVDLSVEPPRLLRAGAFVPPRAWRAEPI
ncbi:MAG: L-threonylcarbamoyladenylate synthase [Thermoanaerobaculales bacterium]